MLLTDRQTNPAKTITSSAEVIIIIIWLHLSKLLALIVQLLRTTEGCCCTGMDYPSIDPAFFHSEVCRPLIEPKVDGDGGVHFTSISDAHSFSQIPTGHAWKFSWKMSRRLLSASSTSHRDLMKDESITLNGCKSQSLVSNSDWWVQPELYIHLDGSEMILRKDYIPFCKTSCLALLQLIETRFYDL